VLGSGREEVCRCLFGANQATAGIIEVAGRPISVRSPIQAIDHGIGYVPQERRTEGVILYLSVAPNITLSSLEEILQAGVLNLRQEMQVALEWIKRLSIRTPSHRALCLNLSGGNQQKVVLAKWLASHVKVLILDHPTRGLDVGAKEEVYELIRQLAGQGMAIILVGDTLEESIGLSSTILAMKDGVIQHRFDAPAGHKPTQVDIIEYMM
jgi:ribose transport system ATP-binding protein